ncbi:syntaxin-18 [Macrosteles quadrilineatus]|uniref:syntaxin-18 n=1 Tax=Macrosteles quadrilineatus TaxID=74068 RepID=UPI0023E1A66A|nr:syntaxin-18 [Macrosteles quadrilineatus]XP_054287179.1 syntaxin-18 [Macrosteles quadrilineatus]XP_054287180.1 syntaxin-18 [Macrosteles quadrilineatus]
MEITALFKACVKTVHTRNKALGLILPELDKNRILTTKIKNSEFTVKAKDVLSQITRLRDFLLEHRKAYLNFSNHLSTIPKMSDSERDIIDTGAQRIVKTCSNAILEMKRDPTLHDGPLQLVDHQNAIVDLLEAYLKTVSKIYYDQKSVRVKRNMEAQKMARLESDVINNSLINSVQSPSKSELTTTGEDIVVKDTNVRPSSLTVEPPVVSSLTQEDELSPEEMQMFERENEELYNDLNSLTSDVRQIETKVVKIAELQEVFAEKVLEQDKDIERIFGTVVGTTENLRDANTQIRQAIQSNASLRFYVIFFLLVMSLTLLFLDWYND